VDIWSGKVFRVRFSSDEEVQRLNDALGFTLVFPFIQPENIKLRADMSFHDQRLAVNALLTLARKEGMGNLKSYEFIDGNGNAIPLTTGIPNTWFIFQSMPKAGTFSCTYACAPENRKFKERLFLAEKMCSFCMDVEEDDVQWWTGLTEVPQDILDLLDWIIGNFDDVYKAFHAIDGEGGNGVVSLRELEEGIRELGCKKFKGKDEKERIMTIFRHLDPGMEGTISEDEWGVLHQLWKEYQLCIAEFVHFLQRTFGSDLMHAWNFLDDDESGELTLDEFLKAVEEIGYFGPAQCVFGLLDKSCDGSISIDEFEVLNAYKQEHNG